MCNILHSNIKYMLDVQYITFQNVIANIAKISLFYNVKSLIKQTIRSRIYEFV